MSNYFGLRTFFKFLSRNRFYTGVEILGFSVAMMFVILISCYVIREISVDRFHEMGENIYVVGNEQIILSAYGIGEKLMDRYPEVEDILTVSSGYMFTGTETVPVWHEGKKQNAIVEFTAENFFSFFSFKLVNGHKEAVLEDRNSAVISESFARAMFGREDPVGKTITISSSVSVVVTGVMEDIKNSTLPYCDILARLETATTLYPDFNFRRDNYDNAFNSLVFIRTQEGTGLSTKSAEIADYFKEFYSVYMSGDCREVFFLPLQKAYFGNDKSFSLLERGDMQFVLILMSVGILILIFAVINYINLTVAQSGFRAKEVAIRNLLGTTQAGSFLRLIAESTLLTLFSLLLALGLAWIVTPYANNLLRAHIELRYILEPLYIIALLGFTAVIGVLSGLLPAVYITRNKAIDVVRGTFRFKTKMKFSKLFIIFQNTVTVSMIVAVIVMFLQINHMIKAPLGYNTENIIDIELATLENKDMVKVISDEISRLPSVAKVGYASGTPFRQGMNYTMEINGKSVSFQGFSFDQQSFDLLNIQKIKENNLATDGYYLNEYALQSMGLDEHAETFPFWGNPVPIAGIIKNFQLYNITLPKTAIFVEIKRSEDIRVENLLVAVNNNPYQSYHEIKNIYERVTGLDFPANFIDRQIYDSMQPQRRTLQIVGIFSFIAIVISILGLMAMAIYATQQKLREISIRKIFGAETFLLLYNLIKSNLTYVLISFIIAIPVIWYLMKQWLHSYSYRIHLAPWIF